MELNKLKTDKKAETNGVRVQLQDATLIIARLNNPSHTADFAARIRPYRGATIPEETQRKLFIESVAEHVLLGWENLTMDGKPFPYTVENAKIALEIDDFADFVVDQARNVELFRLKDQSEAAEVLAKN